MKILSIDIGSYSIKFVESQYERRNLIHEGVEEVVIDEYVSQLPPDALKEDPYVLIMRDYFKAHGADKRKIAQIPARMLTARFFNLPVSSKRKAEQMIPFQLDRELPFAVSDIQYATQLIANRNSMFAIASAIETSKFDLFYKKLENFNALPDLITSELSLWQSFVANKQLTDSYCILDIGHETSKAYMVFNGKIVTTHLSFVGGKHISELIAQTYQISAEEAKEFKHNKSFFLTEEQYLQVDENQREFAQLMKKIMAPLVSDLKRWELGHRIAHGENIKSLFLCGGTSNIKNIENFLAQELKIPSEHLDVFEEINCKKLPISVSNKAIYANAHLMALADVSKMPPVNLRYGSYASSEHSELPLYTSTFLGIRVALFALIVILFLFLERGFLIKREIDLDAHVIKLIKRQEVNIPKKDQRFYKNRPQMILAKVKERYQNIEKEVTLIENVSQTDAVFPLLQINKYLRYSGNWEMTKYTCDKESKVHIEFKADSLESKNQLRDQLKSLPLNDIKISDLPDAIADNGSPLFQLALDFIGGH